MSNKRGVATSGTKAPLDGELETENKGLFFCSVFIFFYFFFRKKKLKSSKSGEEKMQRVSLDLHFGLV